MTKYVEVKELLVALMCFLKEAIHRCDSPYLEETIDLEVSFEKP